MLCNCIKYLEQQGDKKEKRFVPKQNYKQKDHSKFHNAYSEAKHI